MGASCFDLAEHPPRRIEHRGDSDQTPVIIPLSEPFQPSGVGDRHSTMNVDNPPDRETL